MLRPLNSRSQTVLVSWGQGTWDTGSLFHLLSCKQHFWSLRCSVQCSGHLLHQRPLWMPPEAAISKSYKGQQQVRGDRVGVPGALQCGKSRDLGPGSSLWAQLAQRDVGTAGSLWALEIGSAPRACWSGPFLFLRRDILGPEFLGDHKLLPFVPDFPRSEFFLPLPPPLSLSISLPPLIPFSPSFLLFLYSFHLPLWMNSLVHSFCPAAAGCVSWGVLVDGGFENLTFQVKS